MTVPTDLSTVEMILEAGRQFVATYWIKVVAAIAIVLFGRIISGLVRRLIVRAMKRARVEETLYKFAGNVAYFLLLMVAILAALNSLGVQTTSLVAILGAVGLAVGFALKDSLSNFTAGLLLIFFRPFKIDDYVEGAGVAGTVEQIGVMATQLRSPDNRTIIVPNGKMMSDNIVNYTAKGTRRMDLVIGVGYSDNLKKVKETLRDILNQEKRLLADPAPTIGVLELADNSVNFAVRPWVRVADYWDVYFDLLQTIKERLDDEGISIPFPQRDLHIISKDQASVAV